MSALLEEWDKTCKILARRARQRVLRQIAPPADRWEAWCREMECRGRFLSHVYFPSDESGVVLIVTDASDFSGENGFRCASRFSYETEEQAAWREASNRMKRASDLWQQHADMVADPWGRWCTARGASPGRGHINIEGFQG